MEGDPKSWREMKAYNMGDIRTLEAIYERFLPWIDQHPNSALFQDEVTKPTCPHCGGTELQSRGTQRTKTQAYPRFQCQGCGAWLRGRYSLVKGNRNVMATVR
jgi:predicted RNA-binding Zn-ribbon protein involved in translation (DUF1610 family)